MRYETCPHAIGQVVELSSPRIRELPDGRSWVLFQIGEIMAKKIIIKVSDMTCEGCASKIRAALENSGKTEIVDINLMDKDVSVSGSLCESDIFDLVRQAGYTPSPKKKGWLDRIL